MDIAQSIHLGFVARICRHDYRSACHNAAGVLLQAICTTYVRRHEPQTATLVMEHPILETQKEKQALKHIEFI